jgi:hypothetical protein
MHRDRSEFADYGAKQSPRAHIVFGGSWDATGTADFEVPVSPPSSSPAGWAVGLSSHLSKAP